MEKRYITDDDKEWGDLMVVLLTDKDFKKDLELLVSDTTVTAVYIKGVYEIPNKKIKVQTIRHKIKRIRC